ncbi:retrovirus-related pol polyprotein from transposon TNT 1-94 [Tanacetum coccineum]|uniref:Retrovirus-related pol polyprotein from transposon TNT 1-94 n=1 Tax=Tanacetum coccineum TaxID=301880 RepID=A0ABQ5D2G9_9ASTR
MNITLVDDELDEEEAIKVTEKKNLENDIEDETLKIDEIVNIKESKNHPLENVIGKPYQRNSRKQWKLNQKCKKKAAGQQHTEQPEIINEGKVDQYPKQCQVKSHLLDSSPDIPNNLTNQNIIEVQAYTLWIILDALEQGGASVELSQVAEKKILENDIKDETLEIDEVVNIKESRNHPLENVIGNLNQRTLRSQAQNQSNFFCFISTIEPKNVNEALRDESWTIVMQEDLNQFIANDVWELVPQPRNMTILGTKWVFRNKLNENSIVSRNKARLVAQGYNQQ